MSGNGDGGGAFIALLLFAAGPAIGWFVWHSIQTRYRNRDARYRPDRTVAHTVSSLTGEDSPRGRFTTYDSATQGRNENDPDQRARISQFFHGEIASPPTPDEVDPGEREGDAEPPPPPPPAA
ncbi:hypothetical protein RN607_04155 [Demequina capsici]|uniref:Uncharacterized protein n=1 Tax=Demequina capsici TaxID=3075620 RepID=A0AA96FDL5_9MICO|nr:hypothetical protein [Demequina sp. PMTSA13]WNM28203.1 hypothetical protein RN607_04155 [Demequina sp. PMTSA13]